MQRCRGENYFYLSLLWYPSLPALLNSFPLFPALSTHLALTYNCCEPRCKHNARLTMCVRACRCVSQGAFDPIKTSNLDGWKSLHIYFLFLHSFAFILLSICTWLHSTVGRLAAEFHDVDRANTMRRKCFDNWLCQIWFEISSSPCAADH